MLKDIELVIFDLDGTLIDLEVEHRLNTANYCIKDLGIENISIEQLRGAYKNFAFLRDLGQEKRAEMLLNYHLALETTHKLPEPKLILGAKETLLALKDAGKSCCVVTGRFKPKEEVINELTLLEINRFFKFVRTGYGNNKTKLSRTDGLIEVVTKSSVSPENAAYIGDYPLDITTAKKASFAVQIAVLTGGIRKERLLQEEPSAVIDLVKDLLDYLG